MTINRSLPLPSMADLPSQTQRPGARPSEAFGFAQLVGEPPPGPNGEDPALSTELQFVPFMTDDGELVGRPEALVQQNDVEQGNGDDCYFIAALGALAESKPEMIVDNLSRDGEGYRVTFYRKEGDEFVPEQVSVSDAEVEEHARASAGDYADGEDVYRVEQWARIYEAAFVKWKGGPDEVYNRGSPWHAMEALTGHHSESNTIQVNFLSPEQWKEHLDQGELIILSTASKPPTDWQKWLPWNMGLGERSLYEDGTLDYSHAYIVKDITGEGLDTHVELVDPRDRETTITVPFHELAIAYSRGAGMAVNRLGL